MQSAGLASPKLLRVSLSPKFEPLAKEIAAVLVSKTQLALPHHYNWEENSKSEQD
jgi:hypothetical protein